MPNITLTVDEQTYRAARVYAAQNNATVSGIVRNYLRSLTQIEEPATRSRNLLSVLDQAGSFKASERLTREQANAR